MSVNTEYTLWIIDSRISGGAGFRSPLLYPELFTLQSGREVLTSVFTKAFQRYVMDRGRFFELVNNRLPAPCKQRRLRLVLEPAAGHYARLPLHFDYFYFQTQRLKLAFVPSLDICAVAVTVEELEKSVESAIRLEFMRSRRYSNVPAVMQSQWFESVEVNPHMLRFEAAAPWEMRRRARHPEDTLLRKATQRVQGSYAGTFGLENEIRQTVRSLSGKFTRSVLLKGPVGCGKSALVREISHNGDRHGLGHLPFWQTTAAQLIQSLTMGSGWQKNLTLMCHQLQRQGGVLYVKNLAELFEVGQYVGNQVSMGEFLGEFISRGDIVLVSECTDEQAAYIELRSPGFLSHFNVVELSGGHSPVQDDIVARKFEDMAVRHKVQIENKARLTLLSLIKNYSPYAGMPGKAIRFMEELLSQAGTGEKSITTAHVYERFCEETGMPRAMVDPALELDLDSVLSFFRERVFGQDTAVDICVNLLARIKAGLAKPGKPIASLFFVGPTGVGKTELAKTIAAYMFGDAEKMIRFDMSEFSDLGNVLRLTGDVGDQGLLTAAVRRQPFAVILFDELEKAHDSFFDFLLQILGEGRLTDREGRTAGFTSTLVIMTSNIGAESHVSRSPGFAVGADDRHVAAHYEHEVQKHFRPEFFNRLDEVVSFEPLPAAIIAALVDKEIEALFERPGLHQRHVQKHISPDVYHWLAETGYDARYGARYLKRAISQYLLIPLAGRLAAFPMETALSIHIDMGQDGGKRRPVAHMEKAAIKALGQRLIAGRQTAGELLDVLSDCRRRFRRLMDNAHFMELCSKIEISEARIKAKKQQFWKDEEKSRQYHRYTKIQKAFLVLAREIESMEDEGIGYFFRLENARLDSRQLELWKQNEFEAKLALYNEMEDDAGVCHLGLYGNYRAALDILSIYRRLLDADLYVWEVFAVIQHDDYRLEPLNDEHQYDMKPIGLDVRLLGPHAWLYFQQEGGVHVHRQDKSEKKVFVSVNNEMLDEKAEPEWVPERVGRSDFFKGLKSRRVYQQGHLSDSMLMINEEVDDPVPVLKQALMMGLRERLDRILFDS